MKIIATTDMIRLNKRKPAGNRIRVENFYKVKFLWKRHSAFGVLVSMNRVRLCLCTTPKGI